MLTRFRLLIRQESRIIGRCLSDKPGDGQQKTPESNSENEKPAEKQPEAKISATDRINLLLKKMVEENNKRSETPENFPVAPGIPKKRKPKADEIDVKTEKIEESITQAAGAVAEAIGGDVKQTEAELLSKVLGKINQNSTSLSDLILGMKVDRNRDGDEVKPESRGAQVKRLASKPRPETRYQPRERRRPDGLRERETSTRPQITTIDVFAGSPLGIFSKKEPNYGTKLDTWEELKKRELTLATAQPPANYFQKMIMWTEQGKVWKFPIDNEQGIEEERSVHFSEHIFLDAHLEGWCPTKGPIRHFMELVCVGLSKNPFYTVQEKKDHIMWYKEYFESKKDVLSQVGVWDNAGKSDEAST